MSKLWQDKLVTFFETTLLTTANIHTIFLLFMSSSKATVSALVY